MSTKTSNCKQKPDYLVLLRMPLLQKFSSVLMRFYQHFRKKRNVSFRWKKHFLFMNLCPSNAEMLLVGTFSLTGVMQVAQGGQSEYLPVFAQQNLGLNQSNDSSVLPLLSISWQTETSANKAKKKNPEIQGRDLAAPPLFSSTVHPLCLTSQAVEW